MSWEDVLKTSAIIITSLGGFSGIAIILLKFSATTLADRMSKKFELKLSKELEQYKNGLGNKSYVSRARFDLEFKVYEEISCEILFAFDEIEKITPSPDGIDGDLDLDNINEKIKKIKCLLYRSMPILPKPIFDALILTLSVLFDQVKYYQALLADSDESDSILLKSKEELIEIREQTIDLIRTHVASLDVMTLV